MAEFDALTDEQAGKFKDGCLLTAINVSGAPADQADAALANVFLSKTNPPYARLWRMARVLDNSGLTAGAASGTDIDIDAATLTSLTAILGGPFSSLAAATYPDLDGVAP